MYAKFGGLGIHNCVLHAKVVTLRAENKTITDSMAYRTIATAEQALELMVDLPIYVCSLTTEYCIPACCSSYDFMLDLSPVSIQTQSLALCALRKRKPQETQALALASSQSWLLLLRPSIPIGWRLRLLREQRKRLRFLRFSFTQRTQRKRLRLNGNRTLE